MTLIQKLLAMALFSLALLGCQASLPRLPPFAHLSDDVFVISIPGQSDLGNASMMTGILTVKNNCLYVNDYLVVFQTSYVSWHEKPFYLESKGQKITLGSKVKVNGSITSYAEVSDVKDNEWLNSLPKQCPAKTFWYATSIDLA